MKYDVLFVTRRLQLDIITLIAVSSFSFTVSWRSALYRFNRELFDNWDDFSDLPVSSVHLSPLFGLRFKAGFESLLLGLLYQ